MLNRCSIILLAFTLLLLTACEEESFLPQTGEEAQLKETPQQALSQLLTKVNNLRAKGCQCGSTYMPPVGKLSWNADLDEAALRHARDMNNNDFFDHTGSDGTNVSQRVSDTGYHWQTVGENIAWGYQDIEGVFEGWKSSPGHCRNMMSPHFVHMGSARVGKYWVQAFARPSAVGSK